MYCNRCGNVVEESDRFCSNCGAPIVKAESVNNPYAVGTQYENNRRYDVDAPDIPGFGGAVATCFRKYSSLRGRASRSEYWSWVLFVFLTYWAPLMLGGWLAGINAGVGSLCMLVPSILGFVYASPGICVGVRRLHDIGRSGWFVLLKIVPYCTFIVLGILMVALSVMHVNEPGEVAEKSVLIDTRLSQSLIWLYLAGKFVLAILSSFPGQKGANRYGEAPVKHVR